MTRQNIDPELQLLFDTKIDDKAPDILFFISFDVVNSTSIKSQNHLEIVEYQKQLKSSFTTISEMLIEKRQGFRLWKFLGDEFIYCAEITSQNSLTEFVNAAYSTLKEINNSSGYLKFKAVSWVAFLDNLNNIKLEFEGSDIGIDYIGKHIDLGFRLGKHASRNRLVISLMTVQFLCNIKSKNPTENIHFMGNRDLKGIWGVDQYPVFWYDESLDYDFYEKNDPDYFKVETCTENSVENILADITKNEPWKLPDQFLEAFRKLPDKDTSSSKKPVGRENVRHRVELHVATVIYNNKTDKFLIAKRHSLKKILPDIWEFGGGQIRINERVPDGAVRKAIDEFSLKVEPVENIISLYYIPEAGINGIKILCIADSEEAILNNTQHQEFRWLTLSEINKLNPADCVDKMYEDAITFYERFKNSSVIRESSSAKKPVLSKPL